ncbi:MAG: SprT family zinc-dependent metalloprotease [Pseudomonadota bacterium]
MPRSSLFKVEGVSVDVEIRRHSRAKRLILRIDQATHRAVVTAPTFVPAKEVLGFAKSKRTWIEKSLREVPPPTPFTDGLDFPLEGQLTRIHRTDEGRGVIFDEQNALLRVACAPEHLNRRVVDWLKRRARDELEKATDAYSDAIGERRGPVRVRDQKTRWGSCSSDRVLSFSWRLILAPRFVLEYVAAHECAHLKHMDHSKAFWALVDALDTDRIRAEDWLRQEGRSLFVWGNPH